MTPALPIRIASRSETGGRSHNEDHVQHGELDGGWYALLADGAGGHRNGALASELVVRVAAQELLERAAHAPLQPHQLGAVITSAHAALNERQRGAQGRQRMHATLVALWLDKAKQHAMWSHAGDSRLYLLRRGRIAQVTHDDSVVQGMVDAGLLDAAQAHGHPQRNQLLAALGSDEPIHPHCCDSVLALQDGDAFLLCSDGWHDPLDDADIEASLAEARSADDWLAAMQRRLLAAQRAQQDNFSAIAVWVGNPAEVTRIRAA